MAPPARGWCDFTPCAGVHPGRSLPRWRTSPTATPATPKGAASPAALPSVLPRWRRSPTATPATPKAGARPRERSRAPAGQVLEGPQGGRIRQRSPAGRLVGGCAGEDALDRYLELL